MSVSSNLNSTKRGTIVTGIRRSNLTNEHDNVFCVYLNGRIRDLIEQCNQFDKGMLDIILSLFQPILIEVEKGLKHIVTTDKDICTSRS